MEKLCAVSVESTIPFGYADVIVAQLVKEFASCRVKNFRIFLQRTNYSNSFARLQSELKFWLPWELDKVLY